MQGLAGPFGPIPKGWHKPQITTYTPGSYTWVKPGWSTLIQVLAIGGGGGFYVIVDGNIASQDHKTIGQAVKAFERLR